MLVKLDSYFTFPTNLQVSFRFRFPRIGQKFRQTVAFDLYFFLNKFAVEIYDSILEAGQEYGILNCGYFAMRALRVEKFYAFWGQDLDSYTVPSECGRLFRTKVIRISIQTRIRVRSKISYIHLVEKKDHKLANANRFSQGLEVDCFNLIFKQ